MEAVIDPWHLATVLPVADPERGRLCGSLLECHLLDTLLSLMWPLEPMATIQMTRGKRVCVCVVVCTFHA